MKLTDFEYKLFGDGEQTIVVETGIGNTYYEWLPIAEQLKDDHTVLLYHRLGYGRSCAPKNERNTENMTKELNGLLEMLNINECTILAHSFGGLISQHFAALFPEKLKGMILVDSASPRLAELEALDTPFLNEHCSSEAMVKLMHAFSKKSEEECLEMNEKSIENQKSKLSDVDLEGYIHSVTKVETFDVVADEFRHWIKDGEMIQALNTFPSVPLKVICRDGQVSADNWIKNGVPAEDARLHESLWHKLQIALSELTPLGELIFAKGNDHMIHNENPELVLKTVRELMRGLK